MSEEADNESHAIVGCHIASGNVLPVTAKIGEGQRAVVDYF
jgi:hypothetical protein